MQSKLALMNLFMQDFQTQRLLTYMQLVMMDQVPQQQHALFVLYWMT
jgi:hypothetical protein